MIHAAPTNDGVRTVLLVHEVFRSYSVEISWLQASTAAVQTANHATSFAVRTFLLVLPEPKLPSTLTIAAGHLPVTETVHTRLVTSTRFSPFTLGLRECEYTNTNKDTHSTYYNCSQRAIVNLH